MSRVCDVCGGMDGHHVFTLPGSSKRGHTSYLKRHTIEYPFYSRIDEDDPSVCDECFVPGGKHLGECSHFSGNADDFVPGCNYCNRDDATACSNCVKFKFGRFD